MLHNSSDHWPAGPSLDTYPASNTILEQAVSAGELRPAAVSFAESLKRAHRIVEHALKVGDQTTAFMMTEAFARLAMAPLDIAADGSVRRTSRISGAFQRAALDLIALTYPDAWNPRESHAKANQGEASACPGLTNLTINPKPSALDDSTRRELDDLLENINGNL